MSQPSVEENNEFFDEGPEITAPELSSAGSKRPTIEKPNSSDVPKKPRKQIPPRSKVWKHFSICFRYLKEFKQPPRIHFYHFA